MAKSEEILISQPCGSKEFPGANTPFLTQVGHRQVEIKRRRGRFRQLLRIELEDTNQAFWGECCRYLTAQLSKRPGNQPRAEARFPRS